MTIDFVNTGTSLSTRNLAARFRERISSALKNGESVVFNLKGVEVITNSFADECFAKLVLEFPIEEIKVKTTFKDCEPIIARVISNTFKARLGALVKS